MKYFFLWAFALCTLISYSQETTGRLEGKIIDANGAPLAFANILVIDTETNFKFGAISQESGYYVVTNLPPGTAYNVEVSSLGYQSVLLNNLRINLSETSYQDFALTEMSQSLDEVVVVADEKNYSSIEQTLGAKSIKNTPTITRSIQDLTRNLPEANLNSFAGASNRFNNLNIDGVANNDVIGFQEPSSGAAGSSANGSPGSLARTQPIGFGAIKQLSIKTAPFDVSIGNFSGANIDVVTKNGTNISQTELYAFGNNQLLAGRYSQGVEQNVQPFYDFQLGFSQGGALKKDKLFYFINFEQANSNNPLLNAPGSSSSNISSETINAIVQKLDEDYNYNPGAFENASLKTNSTKLFLRLDWNISDKTKLTLRNNFVNSYADNLEWNESIFNFGNQGFRHNSIANSLTAELKSNYNNAASNVLSIGYNLVQEGRDFDGDVFPHIQISEASNRIFAGTYREASVYNTDLNTLQISDRYTLFKNKHTFTFGGLAQYNDVDYGFLSAWNGRWEYSSLDNFLNDQPSRVRGVYRLENNTFDFVQNNPSATVDILVAGLYAQDRFRYSDKLSLTFGLRLDTQFLLNEIPLSEEVNRTPEFSQFNNEIRTAPHINKSTSNYNGYIGYTYGRSKDISSTVRSSPAANFEWNQALTPNNPSLSASNFDLRHKIVSSQSYAFTLGEKSQFDVAALYNGTSGSPFSFVYQGDLNRDGSSRNDLIYIPRDASEINLIDVVSTDGSVTQTAAQQWQRLNAFIESNEYLRNNRGSYAERNESKTPWNHRLDAKWVIDNQNSRWRMQFGVSYQF